MIDREPQMASRLLFGVLSGDVLNEALSPRKGVNPLWLASELDSVEFVFGWTVFRGRAHSIEDS